ncbi:MAG: cupin domain-containing protein [Acidobacteria bacterium]|nr:cupin domain-containing protein [Acidobacteriota bacterium]
MSEKSSPSIYLLEEKSAYEKWVESQELDVLRGFHVQDLNTVPLRDWNRLGGKGVYINLEGTGKTNDAYVAEIPPAASLKPERHLYEELIFVLQGRGATSVWVDPQKKQTFEWQAGSLFAIPLNAWHQHFNGQGTRPARFVAVTSAPLVIDLFHNLDFIFNNDYVFSDRYRGEENFFSSEGTAYPGRIWECNFIPDCRNFVLQEWKERGARGQNAMFELAGNTLIGHVSQFPVGTYKKAHRHGPGAHVILLSGKGYTLLWPEGKEPQRVDWQAGSMFVPPNRWYHQHFNVGAEPARYLALRWGSLRYHTGLMDMKKLTQNAKTGGDQIEYEDQHPEIHSLFLRECARNGVAVKMDQFQVRVS